MPFLLRTAHSHADMTTSGSMLGLVVLALQHHPQLDRMMCRSDQNAVKASHDQHFTFQTSSGPSTHQSSEAPTHPWSVSNPRFLATPIASQPPTLTMHASAAAAPVGSGSAMPSAIPPAQHMALSHPSPEANTAIPAAVPTPPGPGQPC